MDTCAKARYTANTVKSYAMGASEASLIRVAAGLAKTGMEVSVFQAVDMDRNETVVEGVRHVNAKSAITPDVIVHQRTAGFIEGMRAEYPNARHIVWLHDNFSAKDLLDEPLAGEEVVCVSDWHKKTFLEEQGGSVRKATRIYNPVVVDGERKPKIAGRLGFFSSPFKGLAQVCELFAELRKERPWLELVVANPGYVPGVNPHQPGVIYLGELPHPRVLEEMSRCEVLFYPQTTFPETMGVTLAEANAMGTPVLCHDMGAAVEVLEDTAINSNGNCVLNCHNTERVAKHLDLLLAVQEEVEADKRFELNTIVAEWKVLLEDVT